MRASGHLPVVNIQAMANGHHQHQQLPIPPDLAEDPAIPDPVTPQPREVGFERFPETSRIPGTGELFVKVGEDAALAAPAASWPDTRPQDHPDA
jgi:hypothetical protein